MVGNKSRACFQSSWIQCQKLCKFTFSKRISEQVYLNSICTGIVILIGLSVLNSLNNLKSHMLNHTLKILRRLFTIVYHIYIYIGVLFAYTSGEDLLDSVLLIQEESSEAIVRLIFPKSYIMWTLVLAGNWTPAAEFESNIDNH